MSLDDLFIRIRAREPDVSPYLLALAQRAGIPERDAVVAARVARDPRYAEEAKSQATVRVYGRLAYWRVKRSRGGDKYYVLRFPSGFEAKWWPSGRFLSQPLERRVELLTDVLWVEAVDDGGGYVVERIRFMHTRADYGALKRLVAYAARVGPASLTPLGRAAALLFAEPEGEGSWLTLALRWALLSLRGLVHIAEWSVKSVLKSSQFAAMESYARWWHITGERPSLATLIGDARTGTSRLAGVDGVAFDEIGSWRKSKSADDEGFWAAIRTGLANCKWKRSKGGAKSIEFERCVPTYWAGNPSGRPLTGDPVPAEQHRAWLERQGLGGEELDAMLSRFAGFWGVVDPEVSNDLMKSLHYMAPAPGAVRALVDTVRRAQRAVPVEPPTCGLTSRQHVYWPRLYRAVRAITRSPRDAAALACALIQGRLIVDNVGPGVAEGR